MKLSTYAIFMFSLMIVIAMTGTYPVTGSLVFGEHGLNLLKQTQIGGSINAISNDYNTTTTPAQQAAQLLHPNALTIIGAIIAVIFLGALATTLLPTFSSIYLIPLLILLAILNFFVFPFEFLSSITDEFLIIKLGIIAFINLLTVLTVVEFVRGSA